MKLTTADFQDKDVRTLEQVVSVLKQHDPSINLKKYLRLCVVQYTDAVLKQLNDEAKNVKVHISEREDRVESGVDTREGTPSKDSSAAE